MLIDEATVAGWWKQLKQLGRDEVLSRVCGQLSQPYTPMVLKTLRKRNSPILASDGESRPPARAGRGRLCALANDGGALWPCAAATVRVVFSTGGGSRRSRNPYPAKLEDIIHPCTVLRLRWVP
jgi:hypothetical protein